MQMCRFAVEEMGAASKTIPSFASSPEVLEKFQATRES
jgi:hypothetical protein